GDVPVDIDAYVQVAGDVDSVVTGVRAVFDATHTGSLGSTVRSVQRLAGMVRDRISIDMWRALNGLADFPTEPSVYGDDGPTPADVLDLLNRTVITLAAFGGLAVESMTRGEGWRFLDLGRRLERALHMIALLDGSLTHPAAQEGPILDAILEVADSGMTYRRRYLGSLRAEAVIDLLVFDESNPRSLAAQLAALEDDVNHLPRPPRGAGRSPEQRFALAALSSVRMAEPEKLAAVTDGARLELKTVLDHVGGWLPILSDAELLFRAVRGAGSRARFVGITGTNGKSTTTALLAHVLATAGMPVAAGGNLGPAALSLPLLPHDGVYVLEMSSYMLERLATMRFDAAA
ncbi:MAG: alpha-E domain-containing protein, partial [Rhodospirillales bacterium]|nr:alpha-E domain-containing protein [Rhodospirillales bacterium]